jgi:hypothetical protein
MFPPSLEKVSKVQSDDPGLQLEGAHVVKGPCALHLWNACFRNYQSEAGIRNCSKYIRVSKFDAHNYKQGGVSHCGLAIYIKKYLKAKEEELQKLKYFTMPKYT